MYEWDGGTEADQDPPEDVLCGSDGEMADEQLTSSWGSVTCKRCLKIREKQLARWAAEDRDKKVALFDEAQAITRELGYRNIATAIKALRKDAESSKRMLLDACVQIGSIGEALGLDMDADADTMIGTARDLLEGLNRIAKECPLGSPGFAIACEVLGELGVQQEVQP
ncbi:hypothetical protein [Pseudomonas mosselii]|uniref:hypothetical protein n=1 Tax=Pseudomonas mosselii TaxID=78327 RepID=UPI003D29B5C7